MQRFQILIVGAGISGLAAAIALRLKGHGVTVVERHASCQALGGPVGLGPNATRILIEYGIKGIMEEKTLTLTHPLYIDVMRQGLSSGRGWRKICSKYMAIQTLAEIAVKHGVSILFNSPVDEIDQSIPRLHLKNGKAMDADPIVGADGVRSVVRYGILGGDINSKSNISGYNINIPWSTVGAVPELAEFLTQNNFWLGPRQVGIGLNVPDLNETFNICLLVEEQTGKEGDWFTRGDIKGVQERFRHFEPRFRKLLELGSQDECWIWRLSKMPPLSKWSRNNGRVVLVGDAVHAVLPYTGMGAGLCIEDSACLAECLDHAKGTNDLPRVLEAYEKIRKPRAEYLIKMGDGLAEINHANDGPIRQARDERFKQRPLGTTSLDAWDGKHIDEPPNVPAGHSLMYAYSVGYDVINHTRQCLNRMFQEGRE